MESLVASTGAIAISSYFFFNQYARRPWFGLGKFEPTNAKALLSANPGLVVTPHMLYRSAFKHTIQHYCSKCGFYGHVEELCEFCVVSDVVTATFANAGYKREALPTHLFRCAYAHGWNHTVLDPHNTSDPIIVAGVIPCMYIYSKTMKGVGCGTEIQREFIITKEELAQLIAEKGVEVLKPVARVCVAPASEVRAELGRSGRSMNGQTNPIEGSKSIVTTLGNMIGLFKKEVKAEPAITDELHVQGLMQNCLLFRKSTMKVYLDLEKVPQGTRCVLGKDEIRGIECDSRRFAGESCLAVRRGASQNGATRMLYSMYPLALPWLKDSTGIYYLNVSYEEALAHLARYTKRSAEELQADLEEVIVEKGDVCTSRKELSSESPQAKTSKVSKPAPATPIVAPTTDEAAAPVVSESSSVDDVESSDEDSIVSVPTTSSSAAAVVKVSKASGSGATPKDVSRQFKPLTGAKAQKSHRHTCTYCERDYEHVHNYSKENHVQFKFQCPYEDCTSYFGLGQGMVATNPTCSKPVPSKASKPAPSKAVKPCLLKSCPNNSKTAKSKAALNDPDIFYPQYGTLRTKSWYNSALHMTLLCLALCLTGAQAAKVITPANRLARFDADPLLTYNPTAPNTYTASDDYPGIDLCRLTIPDVTKEVYTMRSWQKPANLSMLLGMENFIVTEDCDINRPEPFTVRGTDDAPECFGIDPAFLSLEFLHKMTKEMTPEENYCIDATGFNTMQTKFLLALMVHARSINSTVYVDYPEGTNAAILEQMCDTSNLCRAFIYNELGITFESKRMFNKFEKKKTGLAGLKNSFAGTGAAIIKKAKSVKDAVAAAVSDAVDSTIDTVADASANVADSASAAADATQDFVLNVAESTVDAASTGVDALLNYTIRPLEASIAEQFDMTNTFSFDRAMMSQLCKHSWKILPHEMPRPNNTYGYNGTDPVCFAATFMVWCDTITLHINEALPNDTCVITPYTPDNVPLYGPGRSLLVVGAAKNPNILPLKVEQISISWGVRIMNFLQHIVFTTPFGNSVPYIPVSNVVHANPATRAAVVNDVIKHVIRSGHTPNLIQSEVEFRKAKPGDVIDSAIPCDLLNKDAVTLPAYTICSDIRYPLHVETATSWSTYFTLIATKLSATVVSTTEAVMDSFAEFKAGRLEDCLHQPINSRFSCPELPVSIRHGFEFNTLFQIQGGSSNTTAVSLFEAEVIYHHGVFSDELDAYMAYLTANLFPLPSISVHGNAADFTLFIWKRGAYFPITKRFVSFYHKRVSGLYYIDRPSVDEFEAKKTAVGHTFRLGSIVNYVNIPFYNGGDQAYNVIYFQGEMTGDVYEWSGSSMALISTVFVIILGSLIVMFLPSVNPNNIWSFLMGTISFSLVCAALLLGACFVWPSMNFLWSHLLHVFSCSALIALVISTGVLLLHYSQLGLQVLISLTVVFYIICFTLLPYFVPTYITVPWQAVIATVMYGTFITACVRNLRNYAGIFKVVSSYNLASKLLRSFDLIPGPINIAHLMEKIGNGNPTYKAEGVGITDLNGLYPLKHFETLKHEALSTSNGYVTVKVQGVYLARLQCQGVSGITVGNSLISKEGSDYYVYFNRHFFGYGADLNANVNGSNIKVIRGESHSTIMGNTSSFLIEKQGIAPLPKELESDYPGADCTIWRCRFTPENDLPDCKDWSKLENRVENPLAYEGKFMFIRAACAVIANISKCWGDHSTFEGLCGSPALSADGKLIGLHAGGVPIPKQMLIRAVRFLTFNVSPYNNFVIPWHGYPPRYMINYDNTPSGYCVPTFAGLNSAVATSLIKNLAAYFRIRGMDGSYNPSIHQMMASTLEEYDYDSADLRLIACNYRYLPKLRINGMPIDQWLNSKCSSPNLIVSESKIAQVFGIRCLTLNIYMNIISLVRNIWNGNVVGGICESLIGLFFVFALSFCQTYFYQSATLLALTILLQILTFLIMLCSVVEKSSYRQTVKQFLRAAERSDLRSIPRFSTPAKAVTHESEPVMIELPSLEVPSEEEGPKRSKQEIAKQKHDAIPTEPFSVVWSKLLNAPNAPLTNEGYMSPLKAASTAVDGKYHVVIYGNLAKEVDELVSKEHIWVDTQVFPSQNCVTHGYLFYGGRLLAEAQTPIGCLSLVETAIFAGIRLHCNVHLEASEQTKAAVACLERVLAFAALVNIEKSQLTEISNLLHELLEDVEVDMSNEMSEQVRKALMAVVKAQDMDVNLNTLVSEALSITLDPTLRVLPDKATIAALCKRDYMDNVMAAELHAMRGDKTLAESRIMQESKVPDLDASSWERLYESLKEVPIEDLTTDELAVVLETIHSVDLPVPVKGKNHHQNVMSIKKKLKKTYNTKYNDELAYLAAQRRLSRKAEQLLVEEMSKSNKASSKVKARNDVARTLVMNIANLLKHTEIPVEATITQESFSELAAKTFTIPSPVEHALISPQKGQAPITSLISQVDHACAQPGAKIRTQHPHCTKTITASNAIGYVQHWLRATCNCIAEMQGTSIDHESFVIPATDGAEPIAIKILPSIAHVYVNGNRWFSILRKNATISPLQNFLVIDDNWKAVGDATQLLQFKREIKSLAERIIADCQLVDGENQPRAGHWSAIKGFKSESGEVIDNIVSRKEVLQKRLAELIELQQQSKTEPSCWTADLLREYDQVKYHLNVIEWQDETRAIASGYLNGLLRNSYEENKPLLDEIDALIMAGNKADLYYDRMAAFVAKLKNNLSIKPMPVLTYSVFPEAS